jgi:hypothetical protein
MLVQVDTIFASGDLALIEWTLQATFLGLERKGCLHLKLLRHANNSIERSLKLSRQYAF